jgi:hypothetical protein
MGVIATFLTVLTFSLPYRPPHISLLVPDTEIEVEGIECPSRIPAIFSSRRAP